MADKALVLKLTADGSGLTATLRDASGKLREFTLNADAANKQVGKSARDARAELDSAADAGSRFGEKIGLAIAAVTGGFFALVAHSINLAEETGKLATQLGTTSEFISTLGFAAEQNGSKVGVMNTALEALAGNAAKAAGSARLPKAAFEAIGVSVLDASGKLRSLDELLPQIAAKFASYADGPAKAELAIRLFGEQGAALIPTLNTLGEEGLAKATQRAQEFGQVISTEATESATRFKDQTGALKADLTGLANNFSQAVLPTVLNIVSAFTNAGDSAADSRSKFDGVNTVLRAGAKIAVLVVAGIQEVGAAVGAIGDRINAFATVSKLRVQQLYVFMSVAAQAGLSAGEQAAAAFEKRNASSFAAALNQMKASVSAFDSSLNAIGKGVSDKFDAINGKLKDTATTSNAAAGAAGKLPAPIAAAGRASGTAADEGKRLVESLERQAATFGLSKDASNYYTIAVTSMTAAERVRAQAAANQITIQQDIANAVKGSANAYNDLVKIGKSLDTQDAALTLKLKGMDGAHVAFETTLKKIQAAYKATIDAGGDVGNAYKQMQADIAGANKVLNDTESTGALDKVNSLLSQFEEKSPFDKLIDDAHEFRDALKEALAAGNGPEAKRLQEALDKIHNSIAIGVVDASSAALRGLQSFAKQGSKEFAVLEIAADSLAITHAILDVLAAGSLPPPAGFVAMATMAATVAPLLAQIGASINGVSGSGFTDTAAQRQETQGTGTVLGDSKAQSESIANASKITADATSKLVGINTGMLRALQSLQAGIDSATVMLAHGAGTADFSGMNLSVGAIGGGSSLIDPLGIGMHDPLFKSLFGGKSKVTDQGIEIFAGALTDLINGIAVGAYQEVQSKTWAFGSTHTKTGLQDVSDDFNKQFQLVIGSIVDTVREGAKALGLLPADVEAAIAAFRIEETKISLKDLSAEDQEKAIEAVFSQIFDGLAGSVVPFIDQFQQVGEGLGETLVRVATEVQVTQEALKQLGLAVDTTDPEKFAQISDGLIQMSGGINAFIESMNSFVSDFAPNSVKFDTASDALKSALDQVGLTLPTTRDGFYVLMQSLDATTDAGRKQISTLLGLTDVANQYYDLLDKRQQAARDKQAEVASLDAELGKSSAIINQLHQIQQWSIDEAAKLNALAKSAGLAGASEAELTKVQEVAAQRAAQAIAALKNAILSDAAKLGYVDTLDSLNQKIADLQSQAGSAAGAIGGAADNIAAAADSLNLQISDLSPYSDQKKLDLALHGLRSGTVSADDVLQIGRRLYSSGDDYNKLFDQVLSIQHTGSATGNTSGGNATDNAQLQALIAQRDAMEKADRREQAKNVAQEIADLAQSEGESVADVAAELGINLDDIAKDLGVSNDKVADYIEGLEKQDISGTFVDASGNIIDAIQLQTNQLVDAITGKTTLLGATVQPIVDPGKPLPSGTTLVPPDPPSTGNNGGAGAGPGTGNGTQPGRGTGGALPQDQAAIALLARIADAVGVTADFTIKTNRTLTDSSLKREAFAARGTL